MKLQKRTKNYSKYLEQTMAEEKTTLTQTEIEKEERQFLNNLLMLDYYKKNLPPKEFLKYKKTHPNLYNSWIIYNDERKKVRDLFSKAKKEAVKKYLTR